MNCMIKECNGGFDMAPVIRKMVKARKKKVEGKLSCNGKGDGLASNHASIQYEIKANYKRKRSR
ncbi:MAG: hypothetical protein GWO23_08815 [Gammaproteobacteria bacterium]|nr:hypothetical protein [Gammaproteobacteria bacterium]